MPEFRRMALIGYRASGKSTLGPLIARALEWAFVDMDEVLSASLGESIAAHVERFGWESFRNQEARLLQKLSGQDRIVVATGGGVVERDENRRCLRQHFFTVWIRCSSETLARRLTEDPKTMSLRPSLTGRDVVSETLEVLAHRTPWYEASAHFVLDADEAAPEELARAVARALDLGGF